MNRMAWLAVFSLILASATASDATAGGFGGGNQSERRVRLEMDGGQALEGTIQFRPLQVDTDLGQYEIQPEKIRTIQFLAPLKDEPHPSKGVYGDSIVRGKVITVSGKELVGAIHIPLDFKLELEFGTLTPAPEKLRTLTMLDAEAPGEKPQGQQSPGQPGDTDRQGRQQGGQQGHPQPSSKPNGSNGSRRSPG